MVTTEALPCGGTRKGIRADMECPGPWGAKGPADTLAAVRKDI